MDGTDSTPTSPSDSNEALTLHSLEVNAHDVETTINQHKSTLKGAVVMLLSAVIFSIHGALLQVGKSMGYQSLQLIILRGLPQICLTLCFGLANITTTNSNSNSDANSNINANKFSTKKMIVSCKFQSLLLEMRNMPKKLCFYVVLRGVWGGLGATCYTYTITSLPLGDAIAIVSLYPILTAFTARLFLKEKITIIHIIALIISSIGVVLIAQPTVIFGEENTNDDENDNGSGSNSKDNMAGYIVGLISAGLGSMVFVLIRLAKDVNVFFLIISHAVLSVVVCGVILIIFIVCFDNLQTWNSEGIFIQPKIEIFLFFIILAIAGYGGQYTQNKGGQLSPAGISSLMRSSDIVWSYILQVVFFNTVPNGWTISGATIVMFAIFLVSYEKLKKMKNEYKKTKSMSMIELDNEIQNGREIQLTTTTPDVDIKPNTRNNQSHIKSKLRMVDIRNKLKPQRVNYDKLKTSDSMFSLSSTEVDDSCESLN